MGVLAEVALGAPGRFAAFDNVITLTVRAADSDEHHGPFLPKRDYEDEAQCASNLNPSPLLKHYLLFLNGCVEKEKDRTSGSCKVGEASAC